jgi:hypothetical protein
MASSRVPDEGFGEMGNRVLVIVAAAAGAAASWLYLELVVWRGLHWHIRSAWLRPSVPRRAALSAERRSRALDREIRRLLRGAHLPRGG